MGGGGQNFERRPQQNNMSSNNAMGQGNSGSDMFSRRGQTGGAPNKFQNPAFGSGGNDSFGNGGGGVGQNFSQGMNR